MHSTCGCDVGSGVFPGERVRNVKTIASHCRQHSCSYLRSRSSPRYSVRPHRHIHSAARATMPGVTTCPKFWSTHRSVSAASCTTSSHLAAPSVHGRILSTPPNKVRIFLPVYAPLAHGVLKYAWMSLGICESVVPGGRGDVRRRSRNASDGMEQMGTPILTLGSCRKSRQQTCPKGQVSESYEAEARPQLTAHGEPGRHKLHNLALIVRKQLRRQKVHDKLVVVKSSSNCHGHVDCARRQ